MAIWTGDTKETAVCLLAGYEQHTNETAQRNPTEILHMAHLEETFEGFHCVFKSILKYFKAVSQLVERQAKN